MYYVTEMITQPNTRKPNTYKHTLSMTNMHVFQRVCQSEINRRKLYIGSFTTSIQYCMNKVYYLLDTNSFKTNFALDTTT
jgi:hypothetical protein